MVILCGRISSSSSVVFLSGHSSWSFPAVTRHGHFQWSSIVVISSGHSSWSVPAVSRHGDSRRRRRSVSTVSRPMDTRAGLASTLIQNETHDRMTL